MRVYHYTTDEAVRSIQRGFAFGKKSLLPRSGFIGGYMRGFPAEAYEKVICGLLEAEPENWKRNPDFPRLWHELMYHIALKNEQVALLSFDVLRTDNAHVVERAHIERELHRKFRGLEKATEDQINEATKKYWESRVPLFGYDGTYQVPEIIIWTPIELNRLHVEWQKPFEELFK